MSAAAASRRCSHERRRPVGPGDADAEPAGCRQREPGRERSHQLDAAGDVAGQRACVVERRGEREDAVDRHDAETRLEADDAAACGGNPDRAARVGAERAVATSPSASAAAEPPLDPPAVRPGNDGFGTTP